MKVCMFILLIIIHVVQQKNSKNSSMSGNSLWKYDTAEPELVLSFEKKARRLFLLVYGVYRIRENNDSDENEDDSIRTNEHLIYCFTNANKYLVKKISQLCAKKELNESVFVYEIALEDYIGEYWCEAFMDTGKKIRSSTVLAYRKKKPYEYALRLHWKEVCKVFETCQLNLIIEKLIHKLEKTFKKFSPKIRLMKVFELNDFNDFLDVLLHVGTNTNLQPEIDFAKKMQIPSVQTIYFRNSDACLREKMLLNQLKLTWPATKIGRVAVSEELCLLDDETPLSRECEGSFLEGAAWAGVEGSCVDNVQFSNITTRLQEMLVAPVFVVEQSWREIVDDEHLNVLDIYFLHKLLDKIYVDDKNSSSFATDLVDRLMKTDNNILKRSKEVLSLTDLILDLTDEIFSNTLYSPELVYVTKKDSLIVHVANPFLSNTSGLLLYGGVNISTFHDLEVVNFNRNNIFQNINTQNLSMAVYVPEVILNQIMNDTQANISNISIITAVFNNDSLFVDDKFHSISYVVSVTIPGYGSYLESPIPILLRSEKQFDRIKTCGFWDYGQKSKWKSGEWSFLGGKYLNQLNETNLYQCSFVHLTHFALLVMSDYKNTNEEVGNITINDEVDSNDTILEIITILGEVLSIFGITGIFMTAALFKQWGNKSGTKLLLNLAVSIPLEVVFIHLSEIRKLKTNEYYCKIIGMILHYVVLSKFCWMLIYALLQYFRFVKVIGIIPKNLIVKCLFVGWGAPLVLVFLVGLLTTQSYISKSYELCYPRGMLLYLTVLLPICLVVAANLTVFCLIMYNVSYSKIDSCKSKKLFKLRVYLALLLFSLLGIPWIFGILAEVIELSIFKIILFYIFCVLGTIQGFVLFLFYVVLNEETRYLWMQYFKSKKYKNDYS